MTENYDHIGYLIVGEGKFGKRKIFFGINDQPYDGLVRSLNDEISYWKDRGYNCINVYAPDTESVKIME